MAKEECIGKYPIVCNNAGTKLYLDRDDVLKAMDLYAKQETIEELKSLLDRVRGAHPEYAVEIISERISEIKNPQLP